MKIISVVGARPNFIKIAPFVKAIKSYNGFLPASKPSGQTVPVRKDKPSVLTHILVHTGQHYDDRMSRKFFKSLDIPNAAINLGIGSGTHAEQVGQAMIAFEKVLRHEQPDWVVVVGDVNATLACSVTAKKERIKVCHIEAGLRSGDLSMPEEINRLVTDRLSDLLLIPDRLSGENLRKEGVPDHKIVFVGNIMIDTLEKNRTKAIEMNINEIIQNNVVNNSYSAIPVREKYALLTMHRPSNVDEKEVLEPIVNFLIQDVSIDLPLIWTIHPRTKSRLQEFNLWKKVNETKNIVLLHPLGYHEMLKLNMEAHIILTDSGGLQEESCVLGTPCLTLRWNTERPVTLREHGGASVLVGNNVDRIRKEYHEALKLNRRPLRPELWDGKTAERCLAAILNFNTL